MARFQALAAAASLNHISPISVTVAFARLPAAQSDFVLNAVEECLTGSSIQITNSQAGASYVTLFNNEALAIPVEGNGGVINILVPPDRLQAGQNSIVYAQPLPVAVPL